jgi:phosphatidylglycerophosphatase A
MTLLDRLAVVVATGLGAGLAPRAPGTAGTLVAVPFAWALSRLPLGAALAVVAGFALLAVAAAERVGRRWGDADDQRIVSDEIAGYLVTMAGVPFGWRSAVLGFFLFRLADIVKPWPANVIDRRWKNGAGNVLDDLAAAAYARGVIALVVLLRPEWLQ